MSLIRVSLSRGASEITGTSNWFFTPGHRMAPVRIGGYGFLGSVVKERELLQEASLRMAALVKILCCPMLVPFRRISPRRRSDWMTTRLHRDVPRPSTSGGIPCPMARPPGHPPTLHVPERGVERSLRGAPFSRFSLLSHAVNRCTRTMREATLS